MLRLDMGWVARAAIGAALVLAATIRPAVAGGPSQVTIDNDIAPGTLGSWQVTLERGGESGDATVTAHRYDSDDVASGGVLSFYGLYIDTGEALIALSNGGLVLDEEDPDTAHNCCGSFTGPNGNTIRYDITCSIADGSDTMVSRIEFSIPDTGKGGSTLGNFRVIQFMDSDVENSDDDILTIRGSVAAGNLDVITLSFAELYGVGQGGSLSGSAGPGPHPLAALTPLENATFAGWAAAPFDEIYENLQDGIQEFSPSGVIEDLDSYDDEIVGPSYGPADITSAMAWDVNGNATSATVVTTLKAISSPPPTEECLPGDVFPIAEGDNHVNLADAWAMLNLVLGRSLASDHSLICGDIAPGGVVCRTGGLFPAAVWCPDPDGALHLSDMIAEWLLVFGFIDVGCDGCEGLTGDDPGALRRPGDMVPDGQVDIRDVVAALRCTVGVDEATKIQTTQADVAPLGADDPALPGRRIVEGDRALNIADVVVLLRAAVGLDSLAWKQRRIDIELATNADHVATMVRAVPWPASAEVTGFVGACGTGTGQVVQEGDGLGWACMSDAFTQSGGTTALAITYRGPEPLGSSDLRINGRVMDDRNVQHAATVTVRDP